MNEKITKEALAALLDGREYRSEITSDESKLAKENGLVIVYGASDDLMEFGGAIYGDIDCWEGGTAYLDENGLFVSECEDEDCPYAKRERAKCKTIEAIWCPPNGGSWAYETDIPHATFNVYEDDELYCVGIVFEMAALKKEQSDDEEYVWCCPYCGFYIEPEQVTYEETHDIHTGGCGRSVVSVPTSSKCGLDCPGFDGRKCGK